MFSFIKNNILKILFVWVSFINNIRDVLSIRNIFKKRVKKSKKYLSILTPDHIDLEGCKNLSRSLGLKNNHQKVENS